LSGLNADLGVSESEMWPALARTATQDDLLVPISTFNPRIIASSGAGRRHGVFTPWQNHGLKHHSFELQSN
jgi:hypothetical protein